MPTHLRPKKQRHIMCIIHRSSWLHAAFETHKTEEGRTMCSSSISAGISAGLYAAFSKHAQRSHTLTADTASLMSTKDWSVEASELRSVHALHTHIWVLLQVP